MLLQHPFEAVTPTADGDVLAVLAGADDWFTAALVQSLAGSLSLNGVRNALARLADQGVVARRTLGRQHTYRLNREHLAAPAILSLAGLRTTYLQRLRERIANWSTPPVFAAVFGSAARGDMTTGSDIDLFVVRPDALDEARAAWDLDIAALADDSTRWTGNDTQVMEMSEREVHEGLATRDDVLQAIRTEAIQLAGAATFWREVHRG